MNEIEFFLGEVFPDVIAFDKNQATLAEQIHDSFGRLRLQRTDEDLDRCHVNLFTGRPCW